ncbi:hypothetical protein GLU64_01650 [Nanohaloarchaea archaeon]|nr:hypothetical protein [Candidatus Nanohaloarchaea archaeon]
MNKVVMFLLATVVVASGCTVSGAQPEPEIVQTDTLIGVIGDLDGRGTIMATIYNKGDSGEVDVRAETFDDDGVIATTRETVYIGAGERREVDLDFTLSGDVQSYNYTVYASPSK